MSNSSQPTEAKADVAEPSAETFVCTVSALNSRLFKISVNADMTVDEVWKIIIQNGGGNDKTIKNAYLFQPNRALLLKDTSRTLRSYEISKSCRIEMIPRPRT